MKDNDILQSIKNSIEKAPIDLLEDIKANPRSKMSKHDDITAQSSTLGRIKSLVPYASIAAVFFAVFINWQLANIRVDSQIYFDVNPSIAIETNSRDNVISLSAGNEDGERIIEGIDFKDGSILAVSEEILERLLDEGYIGKDKEFLLLSVYNKDKIKAEEKKKMLDQSIREFLNKNAIEPIVLTQSLEKTSTLMEYATEYGVSVSRMTFIRNLLVLDPKLKIEDLTALTIEELVRLSQGIGLDLEKIIETKDMDKIKKEIPLTQPMIDEDDDYDDYDDDDDDYDDYDDDDDDYDDYDDDDYDDNDLEYDDKSEVEEYDDIDGIDEKSEDDNEPDDDSDYDEDNEESEDEESEDEETDED